MLTYPNTGYKKILIKTPKRLTNISKYVYLKQNKLPRIQMLDFTYLSTIVKHVIDKTRLPTVSTDVIIS